MNVGEWILALVPFIFFPLFILYILLFCVLIKNRKNTKFKSSFYTLFVLEGIGNILTYFNTCYMLGWTKFASKDSVLYVDKNEWFAQLFQALSYHFAYFQYSMTLVIAVNRFTVLITLGRAENFWRNNKTMAFVIFITSVLPVADTFRYFLYPATIEYSDESESFLFVTEMPLFWQIIYLLIMMSTSTALNMATNGTSFFYLFMKGENQAIKNNLNNSSSKGKEKKHYFYMSTATCAVQVVGVSLTFLRIFASEKEYAQTLLQFLPLVSQLLTFVQPVLLLWLSKAIWDEVNGILCCKKKISPVINVTPHSRQVSSNV